MFSTVEMQLTLYMEHKQKKLNKDGVKENAT